jgi:uncharacterized membrane protein YfcA
MPALLLPLTGALLIGLTLGLLGSGGAILTVPVLHFGLGWQEKQAVAGSLVVVGAVSLVAMLPRARRGEVRWGRVLGFGGPGMLGTLLGASLSRFVPGGLQMALFGGVVAAAALFMLRNSLAEPRTTPRPARGPVQMALDGLLVGLLTGLVGVGGGFLIVPALVLLGGLELQVAMGTSLAIIAANSAAGLGRHLSLLSELGLELDWGTLGLFVALGALGSLFGARWAQRLPRETLQRAFAGLLLALSLFILGEQLLSALR